MLNERIKMLRKKRNLTMKELGNILMLGESTISMYEKGKRTPDYTTLKNMATFFCVSLDYLLGVTDNPTPANQPSRKPTLAEVILDDEELSDESRKDLLKQLEMMKMRDTMKKRNEEASAELRPRFI